MGNLSCTQSYSDRRYRLVVPTCDESEINLRIALSHPVVVKYFRIYCTQTGYQCLLDYYFTCSLIRELYFKNKDINRTIEMFNILLKNTAPSGYEGSSVFYILNGADRIGSPERTTFFDEIVTELNLSRKLASLRSTQCEALSHLRIKVWSPFTKSALFSQMIENDEVRALTTTLFLPKSQKMDIFGDTNNYIARMQCMSINECDESKVSSNDFDGMTEHDVKSTTNDLFPVRYQDPDHWRSETVFSQDE